MEIRIGQRWRYKPNGLVYDVVSLTATTVGMRYGNSLWNDARESVRANYTLAEDAPEPDERAARVALEERLDKVERARVYAEDQARHCRSELEAERRKVESLRQSVAARDEKERGKVRRQADTIKALEERNTKLVEKVAAQWARAEEAKSAATRAVRASMTSEYAQTIASLRGEVARLQSKIETQVKLRQEAQDQFVAEARRRKQEDATNPTVVAQANALRSRDREIGALSDEIARLRDRIDSKDPAHSRAVGLLAEVRALPMIRASEYVWDGGSDAPERDAVDTVDKIRAIVRQVVS